MSAADLLAVLTFRHLRYNRDDPCSPGNDDLIFSKGPQSPPQSRRRMDRTLDRGDLWFAGYLARIAT
jgi:hypothetical protein